MLKFILLKHFKYLGILFTMEALLRMLPGHRNMTQDMLEGLYPAGQKQGQLGCLS